MTLNVPTLLTDRMAYEYDDIFSFFGEPIAPGAPIVAHSFEDRFCILNAAHRDAVRARIQGMSQTRELSGTCAFDPNQMDIAALGEFGEWRRFLQTQRKCGMFVESCCLVTDGFENSGIQQVLVSKLPSENDNKLPGAAATTVLFSSPTVKFDRLRSAAHALHGVLGERLLLPIDVCESRLAQIAFDFRNPECEFIKLIWHVRVPKQTLAAHVPCCDLPYSGADCKGPFRQAHLIWQPLAELPSAMADTERWQQDIANAVLGQSHVEFVPQLRSDLVNMVLRLYQQQAHAGTRTLYGGMPACDFAADVIGFLQSDDIANQLVVHQTGDDLVPIVLESPRLKTKVGLAFAIQDTVAVGESYAETLSQWHATSPIAAGLTGISLMCGIRQSRPYVCHNALTLWHSPLPVEVIRVVLNPRHPKLATRGVAHAVIAFDRRGPRDWQVVVTRQRHDESTRLPGGKLEFGETPEEAVRRECFEELGLEADDFVSLRPIPMSNPIVTNDCCQEHDAPTKAINEYATRLVSPKTGELTCYLLYPFWAELTPKAQEKIRATLGQPKHYPRLIDASFWCATGLGYDSDYPRRICDSIAEGRHNDQPSSTVERR